MGEEEGVRMRRWSGRIGENKHTVKDIIFFFFSSRGQRTRVLSVSCARRCVYERVYIVGVCLLGSYVGIYIYIYIYIYICVEREREREVCLSLIYISHCAGVERCVALCWRGF